MLTKKQHQLLVFIDQRLKDTGVSPSYDEMKDALGLASKSGIHRLISALEERGFIRRLAHKARALEVLRLPENMELPDTNKSKPTGFSPNVIEGTFKPATQPAPASASDAVQLPLLGRIAAGTPIEAVRDATNMIDIPPGMLTSGDHYALEVDGDSMIDAGIHDGDTVIIQNTNRAENGTIVVALVDEEEVTLKRLRKKGGTVALEPANPDYETKIYGPDRVQVQGRLVGVIRKY